ncbi:ABC transmembrane type-1 domain-containing protein [Bordetella sputigena]|uniref:ABC transporter permease n=1 Tax=Bordetella sputigena TaxID=1416810 RepID=UPI0039EF024C
MPSTISARGAMPASAPRRRWAAHAFTLVFLAVWEAASWVLPPFLLPGPGEVAVGLYRFLGNPHQLLHLAVSIGHVLGAIALSFVIGALLALLPYYFPVWRFAIQHRLAPLLNAFPGVGWTLLAVMWFGINSGAVIFAISAVLVPFALVNLWAGLNNLDGELLEMSRSYTRARGRQFRLVIVPLLYPFVFATLRIMFGVAWKVTLTAELFGGNSGLGYVINMARQDFDTTTIFVAIVLIVLFVYGTDRLVFSPLQNRLSRHYAQ